MDRLTGLSLEYASQFYYKGIYYLWIQDGAFENYLTNSAEPHLNGNEFYQFLIAFTVDYV